jgi:hypothetical protein
MEMRKTTMNKLTTLAAIRTALTQPGAKLVQDARFTKAHPFYVDVDGTRTPCTAVAERLTYGPKKLTFIGRSALELYFA